MMNPPIGPEYTRLIEEQAGFVEADLSGAKAKLRKLIWQLDVVYFVVVGLSALAFLTGLYLMFKNFSTGGIVFLGIVLSSFGGTFLLGGLGVDTDRREAPDHVDRLERTDFPEMFAMLDSICEDLEFPRWENVSLNIGREFGGLACGIAGRKPTWFLNIGWKNFAEMSAVEFRGSAMIHIAMFHGEHQRLYREIYDRMQIRAVLLRKYMPGLAKAYWPAWALGAAIAQVIDRDALAKIEGMPCMDWIGSVVYRSRVGVFELDSGIIELGARFQNTGPTIPADWCAQVAATCGGPVSIDRAVVAGCARMASDGRLKEWASYGVTEEAVGGGLFSTLAERLARDNGEPAFAAYVGSGTKAYGVIHNFILGDLGFRRRIEAMASAAGADIVAAGGHDPAGLTEEESLFVMEYLVGRDGLQAAVAYGLSAMKVHPGSPWLTWNVANLLFRARPGDYPALAGEIRRTPMIGSGLNSLNAFWKSCFGPGDGKWDEPIGVFDPAKHTKYLPAILPGYWKVFWIEQATKNNNVTGLIACRAEDSLGYQQQFVVAVLKDQTFKFRQASFSDQVRASFQEDRVSAFSVASSNSDFVKAVQQSHPDFFLWKK